MMLNPQMQAVSRVKHAYAGGIAAHGSRDPLPSSLPHSSGGVLVQEPANLPMPQQNRLYDVFLDLAHVASTRHREPEKLMARVARTIGQSFQSDGCLVSFSHHLSETLPATCWIHNSDSLPMDAWNPALGDVPPPPTILTTMAIPDIQEPGRQGRTNAAIDDWIAGWQALPVGSRMGIVRALLQVPANFQGKNYGVISLMRSHPYEWTPSDIQDLETVAHQLGMLVATLQFQQTVEQRERYQAVINQLSTATRNASELGAILQLATHGTAEALRASRGMLLRLKYWDPLFHHPSSEEIPKVRVTVVCEWLNPSKYSQTYSALPSGHLPGLSSSAASPSFWLSECDLCQEAFIGSPKIMALNNHAYHPKEHSQAAIGCEPIAYGSLLIAPLESQRRVLGFLVLEDTPNRIWQESEIEFVELISAQISTAILQTETLRQVQSLVEKRTADLQQSLTIQSKLYERTRQQIEQLQHLNQLKDEFLDTVSHELRTPLTSMSLAIRMLRQPEASIEQKSRYLEILEQQCAQETHLINDLLALREVESRHVAMQLTEIDLGQFIEELTQAFRQNWAAKDVTLNLEIPTQALHIRTDRDSLHRTFLELLTNAGKYANPGSAIDLKILYRQEKPMHQVILSLCNRGPGISPEELPYIFDKFRRGQGATKNAIQGTGLGLALVKSLVQHLSGTISASSFPIENSRWWETCFTLILPQSFDGLGV